MTEEIKNIYNNLIKDKVKGDYEYERWLKSEIKKAGYEMTREIIKHFLSSINFSYCLELGPGQGTWTKELFKINPGAQFDLVDISEEMIKLSQSRFKDYNNLKYFVSDFLEFFSANQYDLFFSVRAIEYIPDKEKAVKKVHSLLKSGGYGFIITKTPKYLRNKIFRRPVKKMHRGQISPRNLAKLLKKENFSDIQIYPVIVNWPLWESAGMSFWLFKIFKNKPLNFISQFFSESYLIKFRKNGN